jgi:hypothetical protein
MNIVVFLNELGAGGTEKAAVTWALHLKQKGHRISVLALKGGPRETLLRQHEIPVQLVNADPDAIREILFALTPDIIHAHVPGYPHMGDVLGLALRDLPIPVVQTNIFGRLENRAEAAWTGLRLFISWTSCIQAAERAHTPLDRAFFQSHSVTPYPVHPISPPSPDEILAFRTKLGIQPQHVLYGRIARPDVNKWDSAIFPAFIQARKANPNLRLLLREPPVAFSHWFAHAILRNNCVILPLTSDEQELRTTIASLDVVLNISPIGESFGYSIAEGMALSKPVIANITPWQDMAQVELVRQGETGFLTGTVSSLADAMRMLGMDALIRERLGKAGQLRILGLANAQESGDRVEQILLAAVQSRPNPFAEQDLATAQQAAANLHAQKWGLCNKDYVALRIQSSYHSVRGILARFRHGKIL